MFDAKMRATGDLNPEKIAGWVATSYLLCILPARPDSSSQTCETRNLRELPLSQSLKKYQRLNLARQNFPAHMIAKLPIIQQLAFRMRIMAFRSPDLIHR